MVHAHAADIGAVPDLRLTKRSTPPRKKKKSFFSAPLLSLLSIYLFVFIFYVLTLLF